MTVIWRSFGGQIPFIFKKLIMLSDKEYILLYRTLIEKKFMLGNGDGKLKQRELEYLGTLIEEKSKIKLSISTLKRLWRTDLNQLPHPSTLDALVSILDFHDWQDFKKQNATAAPSEFHHQQSNSHPEKKIRRIPVIIALAVIVLAGSFFVIQGFNRKDKNSISISKEVVFTADKTVTLGVPNTVMFKYDLSGVQADSFFFQQSWNPRDKVKIDPKKNYYSVIYYTPGFHFARIIANDSILKFRNVHIKTDGWLPIVKYDIRDKKQMYLDPLTIKKDGFLQATSDDLYKASVDVTQDFYLRYYNIRDFDGVDAANFDLETRMKCDKLEVNGRSNSVACPTMEIMIITEQNVFFIPLTTKGCVSELDLSLGEVYKGGKDNDLSTLGTEVYDWQNLRIKSENKKVQILLNGTIVHELGYKNDFGKIKGLIYTFTGPGSMDFVKMRNVKGEMMYSDDFESQDVKRDVL
jgi:hypothetical protein